MNFGLGTIRHFYRNRYNYGIWFKDIFFPDPDLKRNLELENIHTGKRCFILCSGPSIKEMDLKKLKGEIVITQNHFHAHEDIGIIAPKYHVLIPFFHPDSFIPDWVTWFKDMEVRLPKETAIVLDVNCKKIIQDHGIFRDRKLIFMKCRIGQDHLKYAPYDITRATMVVPTVLTQCVTFALYLGFSEIYILGADMNQACNLKQREKLRFYGSSPISDNKAELEIDRAYVESGLVWLSMWHIYSQLILLRKEAEKKNIRIINATEGGLLDCFPRKSYSEIIG